MPVRVYSCTCKQSQYCFSTCSLTFDHGTHFEQVVKCIEKDLLVMIDGPGIL